MQNVNKSEAKLLKELMQDANFTGSAVTNGGEVRKYKAALSLAEKGLVEILDSKQHFYHDDPESSSWTEVTFKLK